MPDMIFQNWGGIGRTLLVGVLAYVALILLLRLSGKRTLAKLNAFDLVVTVAIGSTLATILLSESVALAEGVVALPRSSGCNGWWRGPRSARPDWPSLSAPNPPCSCATGKSAMARCGAKA